MKNLNKKVAAITGAGSGIGQALALELAAEGCDLALCDRDEAGLQITEQLLQAVNCSAERHAAVSYAVVNVAERDAVFSWAEQVLAEHGRVNLLINNAGVALTGTVAAQTVEDYEWITGINYWGVIYGCKAFLPHLEASGEGHIVNISSISGVLTQPFMSGYSATKFAVRGFTASLRQDLDISRSCVSATCIMPGGIKTNVAKSARQTDSVTKVLGIETETITSEFERTFITEPGHAAKKIIQAIKSNKRRQLIGPDAYVQDWLVRLMPSFYQRIVLALVRWRTKAITGVKP